MEFADLQQCLPPPQRLALAYAPPKSRVPTLGLLALDHRLGSLVRAAREPVLAQLKLAWWRDRLSAEPGSWPNGEPLLAALKAWGSEAQALGGLVDGWEAVLLGEDPDVLVAGRAQACAGLAVVVGASEARDGACLAGRLWGEHELGMASAGDCGMPRLPKALRALPVMIRLSEDPQQSSWTRVIAAMRIGLFGR